MAEILTENGAEVSETQVKAMQEAFDTLEANYSMLTENLADVQMMLDTQGWTPMFDYTSNGLTKNQLNIASRQLRELVVGSPTMKKGAQLRHGYIFGKYFEVDLSTASSELAKKKILAWVEKYFSPARLEQWTKADYTDGNFLMVGDDKTKKLSLIPVEQITGVYIDGDDREEVIAFRRSWIRFNGTIAEERNDWYYVDTFEGRRAANIQNEGGPQHVDKTKTIFWSPVNRQTGWTWGIPDALAAIAWARLYRDFLENGSQMSAAMAKIAYKLTSKTQAGANQATAAIAKANTAAQTASLSSTMDLVPLSTAGKGYDFASGEAIAAMIASSIEVSLEDLLSKPDSDKADGLPAHIKRAMRVRQQVSGSIIKRALVWFGAPSTISVKFPEIDDMDTYRKSEMLTGAWGTGLFDPEEVRTPIADNAGIILTKGSAPEGVLIPSNLATVKASAPAITPNADKQTQKPDGSNSQKNGQGRDSQGTGQHSAGNNDLRDGTTKK